ncbi:MAG TPA: arylsulfotransferase family protein [Solirubrobacteraceae bacterium]|nr:arylsulfotransferase family protein [Solirubrobacteraceae bacterium]
MTRRRLLAAGLVAGSAAVLGGGAYGAAQLLDGGLGFLDSWRVTDGADGTVRRFHSAPGLEVPTTYSFTDDPAPPDGHFLLMGPAAVSGAHGGPMITDNAGEPVWFRHTPWPTNFQVHTYRGEPVLVWWEGKILTGYGFGEAVILDRSYREIARVRAANGHHIDLHELTLTDRGTALFTCPPVMTPLNLSSVGGSAHAYVRESIFQEVDIATGRLVREWRSLRHISPAESYRSPTHEFDYMHLNSVAVTPDGNLIISGRHTWALYKLDRASGEVMWRLGGKRSQFAMGTDAQFAWQHDVRMPNPRTITVFDNGDDGRTPTHRTRALDLSVNERARRVTVGHAYVRRRPVTATAMGSARRLGDGHMAVGWGSAHYVTEAAPLLYEAPGGDVDLLEDRVAHRGVGRAADRAQVQRRRDRRAGEQRRAAIGQRQFVQVDVVAIGRPDPGDLAIRAVQDDRLAEAVAGEDLALPPHQHRLSAVGVDREVGRPGGGLAKPDRVPGVVDDHRARLRAAHASGPHEQIPPSGRPGVLGERVGGRGLELRRRVKPPHGPLGAVGHPPRGQERHVAPEQSRHTVGPAAQDHGAHAGTQQGPAGHQRFSRRHGHDGPVQHTSTRAGRESSKNAAARIRGPYTPAAAQARYSGLAKSSRPPASHRLT